MTKPKILVTAAAGKTGFATAMQLLQKGYPVRALVHRVEQRTETLRRHGAETIAISLEDFEALRRSLQGVQRAYFCAPFSPGALRMSALFAKAAEDQKLELVVAMSQWLADLSHPSIHTRQVALADTIFSRLPNVGFVIVNPGWFADNYMAALEPIVQFGMMPMPLGDGVNAPPSNEDIARVIVGALINPERHVGKTYRPTGPKLLSPEDIAATFEKVLGRSVRYRNASIRLFSKVAKSMGFPIFQIAQLQWYFREYQKNAFGVGAPTDAVLEVAGQSPEDFETIVRRYITASALSKRTMASRIRAAMNMAKALLTPAPDLEAFAKVHDFEHIGHTSLAVDSQDWVIAHQE